MIGHLIHLLILGHYSLKQLLEEFAMLGAYCEMHVSLSLAAGIESCFGEMLLYGSAGRVGIGVELQQSLGQRAVSQSLVTQQSFGHIVTALLLHKRLGTHAIEQDAGIVERIIESELAQIAEEGLLRLALGYLTARLEEGKKVLEHTAGGSAGRHKLGHPVPFGLIVIPLLHILLLALWGEGKDVIGHSGCCVQLQIGKSLAEAFQLLHYLLLRDSFGTKLCQVRWCKHRCLVHKYIIFLPPRCPLPEGRLGGKVQISLQS